MISSRQVALAALGPGVPARDVPVGVEHEDRVVADRLDQQSEALLGPPQLRLRNALPGHVLHLQEEVERALHRVEHRCGRHLEPAINLPRQSVLDLHRVAAATQPFQRAVDLDTRREVGIGSTDQVFGVVAEQVGQVPVDAHDPTVESERGHPDRGVVEDLPEALEVVSQHRVERQRAPVRTAPPQGRCHRVARSSPAARRAPPSAPTSPGTRPPPACECAPPDRRRRSR